MVFLQRARIAASAALGFPRFMRLPLVGDIDGRFRSPGARIDDPRFGRSEGLPFTLEVVVDGERSAPAGVGREVDRVFFRDRGKLLFNVSFACGKPQGLFRRGLYGDPRSHWFNVFFGCYQIDVPKRVWGRPFGYREDGRTIDRDEVLRIGKSDWNYFSNWIYGVPDSAITPTDRLDDPWLRFEQRPRRRVNGRAWDEVLLDGVRVASACDPGRADGRTGLYGFPRVACGRRPRRARLPDLLLRRHGQPLVRRACRRRGRADASTRLQRGFPGGADACRRAGDAGPLRRPRFPVALTGRDQPANGSAQRPMNLSRCPSVSG
jgi:hypothetical protein